MLDRCDCRLKLMNRVTSPTLVYWYKNLADANTCIFTAASSQMIIYNKNIVHLQYHGPLSLTDSPTTQSCGPDSLLLKDLIWDEYLYTARYFTLNKKFLSNVYKQINTDNKFTNISSGPILPRWHTRQSLHTVSIVIDISLLRALHFFPFVEKRRCTPVV